MDELLDDTPAGVWTEDHLQDCLRLTLPLGEDEEGPVSATLVSYSPEPRQDEVLRASQENSPEENSPWEHSPQESLSREKAHQGTAGQGPRPGDEPEELAPVLHLHGWSDYFYNIPMARRWQSHGRPFYALDLRKYGRSLRSWQTPGYVDSLDVYDADIDAALTEIRSLHPAAPAPIIQAHSTGGLVAALWAQRHPGRISALVLNSPWLELSGDVAARTATEGILAPLGQFSPTRALKLPAIDNYWQSLSDQAQGEWSLHPRWRPRNAFPIRVGWMRAVLAGHRRVYEGLGLQLPVLVLLSGATAYRRQWTEELKESDSVLDVELLARRAVKLGDQVTVVRIHRALHDVFASEASVRSRAMDEVQRWLKAYAPEAERSVANRSTAAP
ncbi:alpha/beta hydrolase [Nesterenkonia lutea]|uniref:Alpha-beta hydrolase superfamily lysophospholipase n=1 Tax=Nesterenkonia lutea TaxID=272919 RepID=A0ABR9JE60_9MICC|nr:alpha/beta hydrolase [Nesterenkonia lutea]MBE1524068.1 alpha-beta hydrolase superfamily lysophospholipase [Nesterenkonia lutea]